MALSYTSISEMDLGRGLDARSAENLINSGFCEDILNGETIQSRIRKRPGYQGYAGYVPVRVFGYSQSGTDIVFTLDESIDLTSVEPGPLLAYGRSLAAGGHFGSTKTYEYYPTFTTNIRKVFNTGTNTLVLDASDHGTDSNLLFVGMSESSSLTSTDNQVLLPDNLSVDQTTANVSVTYTNGTGSAINTFIYYLDKTEVAGTIKIYQYTPGASTWTESISAATHGLTNTNLTWELYEDTAGTLVKHIPDSVRIMPDSSIEIDTTGTTGNLVAILSAAPIANSVSKSISSLGTLAPGETQTIPISGNNSPYVFLRAYFEATPGGPLESVIPDSIIYDEATDTHTIRITNDTGSPASIEAFYEYGFLLSNSFTVTSSTSGTGSDPNPELTIWGFCHEQIYGAFPADRAGWVNHIDHYRRPLEARAVVGLGGNLFKYIEDYESPLPSPILYPKLRGRVSADQVIGPAFNTPGRTRGTYSFSGKASIESATFDPNTELTTYRVLVPNCVKTGTPIGTDYDQLIVTQMNSSKLNGTFNISSITEAISNSPSDYIDIAVLNPSIDSTDWNETEAGGRAAVETDQLTLLATSEFIEDDRLVSDQFTDVTDLRVLSSSGTIVRFTNANLRIEVNGGLRIAGVRTSSTIPLRDNSGTASIENLVLGDQISYAPIDRTLRITSLDTTANTITVDEELEWQDAFDNSTSIQVPARWFPLEAPSNTNNPVVRHFKSESYDAQSFIKSAPINDSLFVTNSNDEVHKFDGTNLTSAGLIRWEPGILLNIEEGAGATIPVDTTELEVTSEPVGLTYFPVASTEETLFKAGDVIRYDRAVGLEFTVKEVTDGKVWVGDAISGGAWVSGDKIKLKVLYRYYFRLNLIDRNQNIVASAMAQSQDFRARLGVDSAVHIQLMNIPKWTEYDYERLELEIYRTTANTDAFYRVVTLPLNTAAKYISYTDTAADDTLTDDDLLSNLAGPELGTTWSAPLRAKFITSTNNQLVLGNIRDWPSINLNISNVSSEITGSDLNGQIFQFHRDEILSVETPTVDTLKYELRRNSSPNITIDSGTLTVNVVSEVGTVTGISKLATPTGTWIYLTDFSGFTELHGYYQLINTSGTFTINLPNVPDGNHTGLTGMYSHTDVARVPVYINEEASRDELFANDEKFARLNAVRRLSYAINATMMAADTSIIGQEEFKPWMLANAGNDFNAGQVIVSQPRYEDATPAFTSPSLNGLYKLFVDNLQADPDTKYSFSTQVWPSRILVSYPNFPELFDAVREIDPGFSDSVIDINSADGQEITGIIPFFGDSAFGAAQKSAVLVVFKTNSVYLVDLTQKSLGANPVQKLETHGLGCTAPASVGVTRGGVIYVNDSGIFRINRALENEYLGDRVERIWLEGVNRDKLDIMQGHSYGLGQQYKLSVPASASTENSEVLVYDHSDEQQGRGSWVRFDNHPATGWANLGSDAFFGSTLGRVFQIRNSGSEFDFRDDNQPISCEITLRAMDFGDAGRRKALASVISHFRVLKQSNNTRLYLSSDLSRTFNDTDSFEIDSNSDTLNNLSDVADLKVKSIRHSMNKRKAVYLQAKYVNDGIDEPFELAGVTFKVAALTRKGITEAAETIK